MRRLLLAPLVALLVACGGSSSKGGDDAKSSPGDKAAVTAAIKEAATSTDPATCTRLETQRFVEQNELVKGPAAVQRCREHAADTADNPHTTNVSGVKVAGDVATARAAFEGGNLDGQAIDLRLVKQQGRWKLDHIDDFAKFDRKRFLTALGASLARPPSSQAPDTVKCIVGRIGGLSDSDIQGIYVNGDAGTLASVSGPCFVTVIRRELSKQAAVPKALANCVVQAIDKPPYTAIKRILQGADADQLFEGIAQSCLKSQQA
jgi:hypothetical protein